AERANQVEPIRRALRERDRLHHVLGDIRSLADYLPGSAAEQTAKLAILDDIRRLVDHNIGFLDGDARRHLDDLRPPDDLRVLAAADLPASVRRFYTEADGTMGRVVAWFPREDIDVWNGRVLDQISATVSDLQLDDGSRVQASGRAVIFAAI